MEKILESGEGNEKSDATRPKEILKDPPMYGPDILHNKIAQPLNKFLLCGKCIFDDQNIAYPIQYIKHEVKQTLINIGLSI